MTIEFPAALDAGGRLYVAHPAGRVDEPALRAGIDELSARGFAVDRDRRLGAGCESASFLASDDISRSRDLLHGLSAPGYDAVLAARGGYGAMRLLDRLPPELLRWRPRWLVGYSDITALHLWAYSQGVASIHGAMPAGFQKDSTGASTASLIDALLGNPHPLDAAGPDGVSGRLIGGNLSLLAAMRPTRWWPDLSGCLLFIEEIGEPLYRIDRALQTLLLAGGLEAAAGFVVGQCTKCGEGSGDDRAAADWIATELSSLGRPVIREAPAGHGVPNVAFVHGQTYVLSDGALRGVPPETAASGMPLPLRCHESASAVLRRAVDSGVCTAAQLVVSRDGRRLLDLAVGRPNATSTEAITATTPFDLASVTKAICTAPLAHLALESSLVDLTDRCPRSISVAEPTLRDLLRHSSGLPAHIEVFREARSSPAPKEAARAAFASVAATESTPIYSDVGYIALGRWLETIFGVALDEAFRVHIAAPLGLDLAFGPVDGAVATELCDWREEILAGVVHDENAQVLGGVAGHAGLFGNARDVDRLARSLLGHGPPLLTPAAVERMWDHGERPSGGTYTLGWDTPSGARSNAGTAMAPDTTVGHLGFTGTSLWIDRADGLAVTLLTNRVHPFRESAGIRWLRPTLHDAVCREVR